MTSSPKDVKEEAEKELIRRLDQHSKVNNIAVGCQAALAYDLIPLLRESIAAERERVWRLALGAVKEKSYKGHLGNFDKGVATGTNAARAALIQAAASDGVVIE